MPSFAVLARTTAPIIGVHDENGIVRCVSGKVLHPLLKLWPTDKFTKVSVKDKLELRAPGMCYRLPLLALQPRQVVGTLRAWAGTRKRQLLRKERPNAPAFLFKELRQAEKAWAYRHRPVADRKVLFRWLHDKPEFPELPRQLARDWIKGRAFRLRLAKAIAPFFGQGEAKGDFNALRKRMRALGIVVKPWSQQPMACRRGTPSNVVRTMAGTWAGWKPFCLDRWRWDSQEVSPVAEHNERCREHRLACERVERVRKQIEDFAAGAEIDYEEVTRN